MASLAPPPTQNTALNGICPYFTMFPLSFPYNVLQQHAKPGQWVLDPFCGRGTTNYASRLLGLPSIGIDSSPVAVAVAEAKLAAASPHEIVEAARAILDSCAEPKDVPEGEFWKWAFHKDVLATLCRFREVLLHDCAGDARKALRAILLGALHGPQPKSQPSYFSNQAPRTYAPKPRYSVKYWKSHDLKPPNVDVLRIIEERAQRYYSEVPQNPGGHAICADSRDHSLTSALTAGQAVNWIVTSPPYYGMRTYIPDQWLRMWLLGGEPTVSYSNDKQITHGSPEEFAGQLRTVWRNVGALAAGDARMVIRFGGINDRKADPLSVIRSSLAGSSWRIDSTEPAGTAAKGRRQALHFARTNNRALEEHDIWVSRETAVH
jgi:hypothetical protein